MGLRLGSPTAGQRQAPGFTVQHEVTPDNKRSFPRSINTQCTG